MGLKAAPLTDFLTMDWRHEEPPRVIGFGHSFGSPFARVYVESTPRRCRSGALLQPGETKLTRHDRADGLHYFIRTSWVTRVDDKVYVNTSCGEAAREWKSE
jgi:pimeloyl-ACP methyl ester carboxylesterase